MSETNMKTKDGLFIQTLKVAADSVKKKTGLFGFLSDKSITLKNLLFSAAVVGLELLLNATVFDCPLNNHVLYGVMFLVSPFFIVLVVNVLLVGNPWDITDRCCIEKYRRRGKTKWCSGEYCYWVCPNVTKAFVGPCVWLIASFADTEYFVCAAVGQDIEKRNLTNVTEIKELEAEFADAKAWSLIAAWSIFVVLVVGIAIVLIVKNCCLKDNVLLEDEYTFERREAIAALVTFRQFVHGQRRPGDVKNGGANNNQANPNSNTINTENGSGAGEDKKSDGKIKKKKKYSAKAVVPELSQVVEASASSPGTIESVSLGATVSSADANAPVTSPNVEESASRAGMSVSDPSPTAGKENNEDNKERKKEKDGIMGWVKKILGFGQDKDKDEEKDGEQRIVFQFMGKEQEITIYPEGIPEKQGRNWVVDRFEEKMNYHEVYKKFKKHYPRVTKGKPWDPWVNDKSQTRE